MELKDYIIQQLALSKAQLELTVLELQFKIAQLEQEKGSEE